MFSATTSPAARAHVLHLCSGLGVDPAPAPASFPAGAAAGEVVVFPKPPMGYANELAADLAADKTTAGKSPVKAT